MRIILFCLLLTFSSHSYVGDSLIKCAKEFLNTPYDPDPLGAYVSKRVIVYDEKVDCMYLVFRCTEVTLSNSLKTPEEIALHQRFHGRGILNDSGKVVNYEDRFTHGEDMVMSNKWGKNITSNIGRVLRIASKRVDSFEYVANQNINMKKLQNGDVVFFILNHAKIESLNVIVGHMGFIEVSEDGVYLIHASGKKSFDTDGRVQRALLSSYLQQSPFVGIAVKRFKQQKFYH